MGQLIFISNADIKFQNPSIHSWFQRYVRSLNHNIRTNGQAQSNYALPTPLTLGA